MGSYTRFAILMYRLVDRGMASLCVNTLNIGIPLLSAILASWRVF